MSVIFGVRVTLEAPKLGQLEGAEHLDWGDFRFCTFLKDAVAEKRFEEHLGREQHPCRRAKVCTTYLLVGYLDGNLYHLLCECLSFEVAP